MTAATSAYARRGERVRRGAASEPGAGGRCDDMEVPFSFDISKVMELWKLYHTGMPTTPTRERIAHPETSALDLATVMRVVGDPVRLEVVRLLGDGQEHLCGELSQSLQIPASTGSYHLKLLREAGITRTRAEGTQRFISLRSDDLEARFPGLVGVLIAS